MEKYEHTTTPYHDHPGTWVPALPLLGFPGRPGISTRAFSTRRAFFLVLGHSHGVADMGGNSAEFWRAVGPREENRERITDRQWHNVATSTRGRYKIAALEKCRVPEAALRKTWELFVAELEERTAQTTESNPRIHPGSNGARQLTRPNPRPKGCKLQDTLQGKTSQNGREMAWVEIGNAKRRYTHPVQRSHPIAAWGVQHKEGKGSKTCQLGGTPREGDMLQCSGEPGHPSAVTVQAKEKEGAFHTQLANERWTGIFGEGGYTPQRRKETVGFLRSHNSNPSPSSKLVGGPETTGTFYPDKCPAARGGSARSWCETQGRQGKEMLMSQLRHQPIERVGCQITLKPMGTPRFVKPTIGQDVVENGEERRRDDMDRPSLRKCCTSRKRQSGCPIRQEARGVWSAVLGPQNVGLEWQIEHLRKRRVRGIQKEVQARVPSKGKIVEDRRHEGDKQEKDAAEKRGGTETGIQGR
ncbi:hypothetical protein K438DRAFT_1766967 [Mycena galopus ATCC 62051]|nr:hypothetical protein K438DRAFT_1766967 [Mycena galopus ATCC 62051]